MSEQRHYEETPGKHDLADSTPLFVDLDGTIIATDVTLECVVEFVRKQPWKLPMLLIWVLHGRAYLKRRLSERVQIDATSLPYRPEILEFLRGCRSEGRTLVLATAADERVARRVAEHLGLFDGVIASDGHINCKSKAKLAALRDRTKGGPFDYMGDSRADLAVWRAARRALVVSPTKRLAEAVERQSNATKTQWFFAPRRKTFRLFAGKTEQPKS